MKRVQLLSTVAAGLLLTTGAAFAQGMNKDANPAPAPAAQQNAPAEKVSPNMKAGEKNADTHKKPETTGQTTAPASPKSAESPAAAPKSGQTTTGQGSAAGAAKLSTEQRTKITTVFKQQKVERVEASKLNISINVGTRVPSTVKYHPIPQEVIVIYPEWRGFDYILVGDQIVVLDPRSHEIVAILEA